MSSSTGGKHPPKSSSKSKNDRRKAKQQQQVQELAKLRAEIAQLQRDKELQNVSASGIFSLSASVPGTQVPVSKTKKSTASDLGQQK